MPHQQKTEGQRALEFYSQLIALANTLRVQIQDVTDDTAILKECTERAQQLMDELDKVDNQIAKWKY